MPSDPDPCAICLFAIELKHLAIVRPCNHRFDLSCISRWLEVSTDSSCPLCKTVVTGISFDHVSDRGSNQIVLSGVFRASRLKQQQLLSSSSSRVSARERDIDKKYRLALLRRRYVYRNRLRACYMGCNKYSGYIRLPVGRQFDSDAQARAKSFIRRELAVFPFLLCQNPYDANSARSSDHTSDRFSAHPSTSREIEFLTVYVMSVLELVDVQTAKGAKLALSILSDHLGAINASIFLHELCCFMRSPCKSVAEYDRVVQYMRLDPSPSIEEYGQPLARLSERQIIRNLHDLDSDILEQVPRAYSMKRHR